MKVFSSYVFLVMAVFICFHCHGQIGDNRNEKNSYYFNVNEVPKGHVFEIKDNFLSFQYHDKYGKSTELPLTIYNWKNEILARLILEKVYGVNYYSIDVSKDIKINYGEIYHLKIQDERGLRTRAAFRFVESSHTEIAAEIIVNPLNMKCDDPYGNTIEFYGNVNEGRRPYTIRWYIMDGTRTSLLYQPITEVIKKPGFTSVVTIDHIPAYYVMFYVIDACGNEQKQMVHLVCEQNKKSINTIFIEPLREMSDNNLGN